MLALLCVKHFLFLVILPAPFMFFLHCCPGKLVSWLDGDTVVSFDGVSDEFFLFSRMFVHSYSSGNSACALPFGQSRVC